MGELVGIDGTLGKSRPRDEGGYKGGRSRAHYSAFHNNYANLNERDYLRLPPRLPPELRIEPLELRDELPEERIVEPELRIVEPELRIVLDPELRIVPDPELLLFELLR